MNRPLFTVASPPPRPLLVWDGDCRFCGMWARRWNHLTGEAVDYQSYQEVGNRFPEITQADYGREIYLILPDGRVYRAAEAVYQTLALGQGHRWWLWLYEHIPGFAPVSEFFYRCVANNRFTLSWLTRIFWGDPGMLSTYRFSGMLFLRMLGLVYLVAFVSFWGQADGLVGDHGILPVKNYFDVITRAPNFQQADVPYLYEMVGRGYDLQAHQAVTGFEKITLAPSLLWFSPNSAGLHFILYAGMACALLEMMGLVPGWAMLGCVLAYSSLRGAVPVFLNFQWDILLVESGVVALLFAPWGLWQKPMAPREPPALGRWSVWWLLFKLMVMSGLVKLLWNDPNALAPAHPGWFRYFIAWLTGIPVGGNTWLDGTALQYHYFTQPIPAATSWWFAQRSLGFQAASVWACMAIELAVPFFFFAPRRLRHIAAVLQIFLQVMFMVSGNYGFFNLLTIVLCLPLFDDTFWPARVRKFINRGVPSAASMRWPALRRTGQIARAVFAGFIFFIGLVEFRQTWQQPPERQRDPSRQPGFADKAAMRMQQFGLVSSYGLFRVMTTARPELVIEGSDDGQNWKEYDFVWKPGDVLREPTFSTPHMPRLDWQMWFAALEIYGSNGQSIPLWLKPFLDQLRAGNPTVIALLDHNPFPNGPPRQLQVRVYLYRFATPIEHEKAGAWWVREPWLPASALPAKPSP